MHSAIMTAMRRLSGQQRYLAHWRLLFDRGLRASIPPDLRVEMLAAIDQLEAEAVEEALARTPKAHYIAVTAINQAKRSAAG